MTTTELSELIAAKLGIDISIICAEQFNVRFHYHGHTYRVSIMDLSVGKVDGAWLVTDSDARQLEKLLRGEQWDGTGLPPVGTECEFYKHDPHVIPVYEKGKIQYFSDCTVVIKTDKPGEIIGHPINFEFRSLRTERDKAIEQIRKVGSSLPASVPFAIEEAAAIYDAIVAGKIDGLGKVG